MALIQQQTNVPNVLRQNKSLALLTDVAYRLDTIRTKSEAKRVAQALQGGLTTTLDDEKSTIINLKYTDTSPERAERVLNTIIEVYNERWINEKKQMARNTASFIDERLVVIEKSLNQVDDSISTFKTRHHITNLEQASDLYLQQQNESETEILQLTNQLYMAQYILDVLKDNKSRYKLLPAHTGLTSSEAGQQIAQYNTLLLKLKNNLEGTSTQNPIIMRQEEELGEIRQNIIATISNYIKTIQIQIGSMQGYNADVKEKVTSNPDQAKKLLSVERDQKVMESLYLYLLQKKEENEISMTYTPAPTQVVDMPHGSPFPPYPNKKTVLLVVELPLIDNCKKRVELNGFHFKKNKRSRRMPAPLLVQQDSQNAINEAFRILRSNIEFMSDTPKHKNVYLVTSMFAGSGKSFITVNLALALAIKGRRVLVIDGDMRRATATHTFGNREVGLANYLGEKVEHVEEVIYQHDEHPSLYILPVGTTPPNPTELLSSPRMPLLLEQVRPQFDFILIDCPMTESLADASIIEHHVDRTLYVIRAGLFQCRSVYQLDAQVQNGKYKNLSIVLNAIKPVSQYGYKYGYYYNYKY